MKNLIIDKPALQALPDRLVWATVTALFWLVWFYLWLPWITLAAWFVFGYTGYLQYLVYDTQVDNAKLFGAYLLVIQGLGALLLGWAFVEWWRFHGHDRRRRSRDLDVAQLAAAFELDPARLKAWQGARRLVVSHDGSGRVTSALADEAAPPALIESCSKRGGNQPAVEPPAL